MTLEELNTILNQLGLNMVIVGYNVYFFDCSTNEIMVTGYEELDENDHVKKIRAKRVEDLLNGGNFWAVSDEYEYKLSIYCKDDKFFLTKLDKDKIEGFRPGDTLRINKDSENENAFSFTYTSKTYNSGYIKRELIVNSNDRITTIDYKVENLERVIASYYSYVASDDDQALVSYKDNRYTTIISFTDIVNTNPAAAKILEVVAPNIYAKCLKTDEIKFDNKKPIK